MCNLPFPCAPSFSRHISVSYLRDALFSRVPRYYFITSNLNCQFLIHMENFSFYPLNINFVRSLHFVSEADSAIFKQ